MNIIWKRKMRNNLLFDRNYYISYHLSIEFTPSTPESRKRLSVRRWPLCHLPPHHQLLHLLPFRIHRLPSSEKVVRHRRSPEKGPFDLPNVLQFPVASYQPPDDFRRFRPEYLFVLTPNVIVFVLHPPTCFYSFSWINFQVHNDSKYKKGSEEGQIWQNGFFPCFWDYCSSDGLICIRSSQ